MTPLQTYKELMKGCKQKFIAGFGEDASEYTCGLRQLTPFIKEPQLIFCPSCQSRLNQFKSDLKMFKEMIESLKKTNEKYFESSPENFRAQYNHTIVYLDMLLAPISEVLKEMGE